MKRILSLLILLFIGALNAQVQTPQPSPSATLKQVVGLTQFEVKYSRPSMNKRDIFGGLVPYDKLWRTGANTNTTISFDQDIYFNGEKVKTGTYSLYTKPGEKEWIVYLYSTTDNWGTPQEWDESKIVTETIVESKQLPTQTEAFTIEFNNFTKSSAHLILKWENTAVNIPIEVPTDEMVMKSIEKSMKNPKSADYFNVAVYFLETDRDINQARQWIDKAMELREDKPYWMLRQQSLIYAKSGFKNKAISLATQSLEAAKKAGNRDYVEMNKTSLKKWGAY
ncbi:DUF2911 domain-containing protein [Flavobacterium sp. CS20]|uniref:DUF2911 domain-containing protein n=1 Tax=Flavobacterium sp. CS20 TaxID=2775246 RepID=UPI001B3A7218|nr:DUF2911 domain-containing protein [Flavobacterium sp. CS20]QTY27533.1 DUF2911 domain-containing protein [Flavobacterium sp. CS20]